VRAIATIHDLLYKSDSLARVDMAKHIQSLARDLYSLYGVEPEKVTVNVRIDGVQLEIEQAIPCTLIVNELLSNAFKYAFPQGAKGEIQIVLERANEKFYCMSVKDNGVGLPPQMDFRNTSSLGMQLINIFVDQLQGSITSVAGKGTNLEVKFPVPVETRADCASVDSTAGLG
jgi:two-component sensor histidine kinase